MLKFKKGQLFMQQKIKQLSKNDLLQQQAIEDKMIRTLPSFTESRRNI